MLAENEDWEKEENKENSGGGKISQLYIQSV